MDRDAAEVPALRGLSFLPANVPDLWRLCVCVLVGCMLQPAVAAAQEREADVLLVHLPAVPIENAARAAAALTELGQALGTGAALDLRVEIFRRWQDAHDYLEANGDRVALVLSEVSFLLDLPPGIELQPVHRFVRNGEEVYRRVLVVRAERAELQEPADLSGASVVVVETAGSSLHRFLQQEIFAGRLDPADRFQLVHEEDDFSATANVLFQQADAALIAEYNPLLAAHLGDDLRTVYTSPPLSLPVLSVGPSLDPGRRQALAQTVLELPSTAAGALRELGIEGLNPVRDPGSLWPNRQQAPRALEIALPSDLSLALPPLALPPPPAAGALEYGVTVTLPSVPLPEPALPGQSPPGGTPATPPP